MEKSIDQMKECCT